MMTKSLTKTTKKKNISNRNSQNVTVGTLADAQQQDGDKNNGGESNGSSSSSNNGIGIGKGSKGSGENKNQKGRYMYCDFAQIEEEEYDVDYEIDQEGLLQALDEATTMAAAQTVQHQTISYLQQPVSLISQLKPFLSLSLFFLLFLLNIRQLILILYLPSTTHTHTHTHAYYLSHQSYELLVGLDHKDFQRNCTHFYHNHNYLISSHGCLMVVVGKFLNQESLRHLYYQFSLKVITIIHSIV